MKLAVIALGGNALIRDKGHRSPADQKRSLLRPANSMLKLLKRGYKIIVTHGNGPQVGDLWDAEREKENPMPLHECVRQTQVDIGKYIESVFRGVRPEISIRTVITHVRVDKNDIAFSNPAKGIGRYFEAPIDMKMLSKLESSGSSIRFFEEDGYREVVASPRPEEILEVDEIRKALLENDVVIACGGGGIPVFKDSTPARAVVDKDLASERLASAIGADCLIILTGTGGVALDFDASKKEQDYLDCLNVGDAEKLLKQGYFEEGTIEPKVAAAVSFFNENGKETHIGSINGDLDAILLGREGTIIGKGKTALASGKPVTL